MFKVKHNIVRIELQYSKSKEGRRKHKREHRNVYTCYIFIPFDYT